MVIGLVVLGVNSSVWFGVVICGDNDLIEIGDNINVQENFVLYVDLGVLMKIGNGVIVGYKVMLYGCIIGDNSLIGINVVVLNKVRIGKNCIIGVYVLVFEGMEIFDNFLVMGVLVKVVKEIFDGYKVMFIMSSQYYVVYVKYFEEYLEIDECF